MKAQLGRVPSPSRPDGQGQRQNLACVLPRPPQGPVGASPPAPFSQPSLSAQPPEIPPVTALHSWDGELRPRERRPGRVKWTVLQA